MSLGKLYTEQASGFGTSKRIQLIVLQLMCQESHETQYNTMFFHPRYVAFGATPPFTLHVVQLSCFFLGDQPIVV